MAEKRPGFVSALKGYFGFREGTCAADFAKEIKALSYEEKCQFYEMLTEQAGIDCDPPLAPSK